MDKKSRVTIIEVLRGLAALSVSWYHFTNGQGLLQEGWLKQTGSYGWLGVECFFVISGFVIPLSMYRGNFKFFNDWRIFFGKRLLRLEPPYFVSIVLTVALWYASTLMPGFAGQAPNISWMQLMGHLGSLNAFLGYDWINPVFWTLAIEFQYYILIAFCYVLIAAQNARVRWISTIGLGLLSFLPIGSKFILHFIVLFVLGIVTFQHHVGLVRKKAYFLSLLVLSVISFFTLGYLVTLVGLFTALLMAFVQVNSPRPLTFLGTISYSMYLFHVSIGGRIVNLGRRFAHTWPTQIWVLLLAVALTIASAYLIYLCVERPAKLWSASLKYRSNRSLNVGV
jgi:peptidoglycan/LPS O-acetylase OafA/YrhL